MERINYNIADRDALFAQLRAEGKAIVEDVTIDLDEHGVPQTCYCVAVDMPAPQPDETDDMREALEVLGVEV